MRQLINGCYINYCRYIAQETYDGDDVGQIKFLERNIGDLYKK